MQQGTMHMTTRTITRRSFTPALMACLCLGFDAGMRAHAADGDTAAPIRVACVGDSITQDYPPILGRLLGERYQVRSCGFSGGTVMNVNDRPYSACAACKEATAFNPDIVVFMLGTNDSKPDEWKHKERFKQDLIALLDHFAGLPAKPKIWVCTPPWIAKHYPGGHDEAVLNGGIIPIIRAVAAERKLPLIDMHALFQGKPELFVDGIHPNAAGCEVLAKAAHTALSNPHKQNNPPK
jgi:lysophospholipase L1-like esterase